MRFDAAVARRGFSARLEAAVATWSSVTGARTARVIMLPLAQRRVRLVVARRTAQFAVASGAGQFLTGLLARLGNGDHPFRLVAFELYLTIGDLGAAERIAATLTDPATPAATDEQLSMTSGVLLARGDAAGVLELSPPDAPEPDRLPPSRRLAALRATGRPRATLALIDGSADSLGPTERALARFDAHWQLGDPGQARAAVDDLAGGQVGDHNLTSRLRSAYEATGSTAEAAYERVLQLADAQPRRTDVDWRIGLEFGFNHLDDLLAEMRSPDVVARAGPRGRYLMAAALYCRRDFEHSRSHLAALIGTTMHWDAQKLADRMLLEEGRFTTALEHRARRSSLRPTLDEVEYFTRLHLEQYRRGFRMYLPPSDARRLEATFGAVAERLPADGVSTRFVIAQDGPGDEISMSATYPQLLAITGELAATCDPRLASLLRRSFPDVEFVPTRRQPSRPALGFLADGEPERATGNLYDLLSAEAMNRAVRADRVVLQRSLIQLTPAGAPYAPYLRPDPTRITAVRDRIGPERTTGLVWRSEYVDAMRSIHFLTPPELAGLRRLDGNFVCLQHDATPAEREQLVAALGDRVKFLDGLDLRDDFETMAAVAAVCDAVVGVGTTMTELAAAVGTTTVYLHPNLIGAWRRQDGDADYWHATMRTAVVDDAQHRSRCVDRAVEILRPGLGRQAPSREASWSTVTDVGTKRPNSAS